MVEKANTSKKSRPALLIKAKSFVLSIITPLVVFIFAQLVAYYVLHPFLPGLNEETQGSSVSETFIYLVFFELIALGLVCLLMKIRKKDLSWLGLGKLPKTKDMLYVLPAAAVYVVTAVLSFYIIELLNIGVNLEQEQTIGFEGASGNLEIGLAFVALVILTPLTEEILIRGILFRNLNRTFGFIFAAVVSALIFGILHGQVNVFIDTFILGLLLAWLVNKTDSLWPAIGLHGLKNLIAFLYLFVF